MDPSRARDLIEGMARARELLEDVDPPSEELRSRAKAAAAAMGADVMFARVIDDEGQPRWSVSVATQRGVVATQVKDAGGWEQALGVLGVVI